MKHRGALMVMLSLLFGFGAAWAAKNWIEQRTRVTVQPESMPVVVAAMEIPYGTKIEGRHVKIIAVPKGTPLGDHFSKPEEIEGLVATQKVLDEEVLLKARFTQGGAGSTLAALIKPEMRAITVRVDDVVGVAGFLLPGNHVDVLAARRINDRATTETILMDVNVLAVDQSANQDKNEPVVVRAVTLEMTPEQTEILVRAREEGRIQLTLRNPNDETQLVAKAPPPAPAPAPAKKARPAAPEPARAPAITIIRGTNVNSAQAAG